MGKITVITVYYNRENDVVDSVNSVINQMSDIHEFIIVDDGSTDQTLSKIKSCIASNKVKLISHKNIGFTKSIIKAIDVSSGDYIAIHGSGDISEPGRFANQCCILDEYPNVVLVGCKSKTVYEDGSRANEIAGNFFYGSAKRAMSRGNLFSHGEVMFRKSSYTEVGGYREFFEYAQDKDLWCRLSTVGDFYKIDKVLYTKFKNRKDSVSGTEVKLYRQQLLSCYAEYLHINSGFNYENNCASIYSALAFKLSFRQRIRLSKIYARLVNNENKGAGNLFKEHHSGFPFWLISHLFVFLLKVKNRR